MCDAIECRIHGKSGVWSFWPSNTRVLWEIWRGCYFDVLAGKGDITWDLVNSISAFLERERT